MPKFYSPPPLHKINILIFRKRQTYAITRMLWGKRNAMTQKLKSVGLFGLIQTAFIERVNLTIRQSPTPLRRKT
jgi:hypothetical protein